jgi:hypothetical protein
MPAVAKKNSRKPVVRRRLQVVKLAALDSTQMLAKVTAFQDDLQRFLSDVQFHPRTLLTQAAGSDNAKHRALLLAEAERWYTIRRVLRGCGKAFRLGSQQGAK